MNMIEKILAKRNGSPKANMDLASALSVPAAATAGEIVDRREFL